MCMHLCSSGHEAFIVNSGVDVSLIVETSTAALTNMQSTKIIHTRDTCTPTHTQTRIATILGHFSHFDNRVYKNQRSLNISSQA